MQGLKRKADELDSPAPTTEDNDDNTTDAKPSHKEARAAPAGFIHLLYPTPETWTLSLPHRTQVVYTPDYSYILHRLRARPGSTVIEAGAGSGSFTHAAVRAVFNGYPTQSPSPQPQKKRRLGQVYSFEFHSERVSRVKQEIHDHGLEGLVTATHRDVYADGFLLDNPTSGPSPKANVVFLDLPAPWLALKHLVRNPGDGKPSPLDPTSPVHICTFSPCLEQAQRTISTLRQMSWLSISMVEVNHKRIETRRERCGLDTEGLKNAIVFPKSVDEAVTRMRNIEIRAQKFRSALAEGDRATMESMKRTEEEEAAAAAQQRQPAHFMGRVVHRTEPDLKNHTSYLVFAVLPQEWSEEDEKRCREVWPSRAEGEVVETVKKSKRQIKMEEGLKRKEEKRREAEEREKEKEKEKAKEKEKEKEKGKETE